MTKSRLEAFSDGVLAIILTIMVLELHWPKDPSLPALEALLPGLATYLLSFVFIGIYWVNHHHTFQIVHRISGGVLWANLHLLFWLSLIPLGTGWMADGGLARLPVLFFGCLLLGAAVAYFIMIRALLAVEGPHSQLAEAIGRDYKGLLSLVLYVAALLLGLLDARYAYAFYVAVALMWLIPDSRIERRMGPDKADETLGKKGAGKKIQG